MKSKTVKQTEKRHAGKKEVQTHQENADGAKTAKPVKVLSVRHAKPGELKPIKELLEIPDEQIPDDTIEEYIALPSHTHWQFQEIRRRIIEHWEKNCASAQFGKHLEEFSKQKREWGSASPIRMNVTLALGEWEDVLEIATAEGWTMEEAVSTLLWDGIEGYMFKAHKKKLKAEYFEKKK